MSFLYLFERCILKVVLYDLLTWADNIFAPTLFSVCSYWSVNSFLCFVSMLLLMLSLCVFTGCFTEFCVDLALNRCSVAKRTHRTHFHSSELYLIIQRDGNISGCLPSKPSTDIYSEIWKIAFYLGPVTLNPLWRMCFLSQLLLDI